MLLLLECNGHSGAVAAPRTVAAKGSRAVAAPRTVTAKGSRGCCCSEGTMQVGVTFVGVGIDMSAHRLRPAFVWPAACVTHQQVWGASN